MELRHLEYLVAVVEEGSFTRAAARVHVAQPGVSAQIRRLEAELGQDLLDRSGRGVTLTQAGQAVLPYARAALAAAAGAKEAVGQLTGLLRGRITIGTVTSMASENFDLVGLLSRFHHDHPNVDITLSAANSDELARALRDGRLDFAILGLGRGTPDGLDLHVVTEEPLVGAVSRTHPLAGQDTITLAALTRHPLISLPAGTGLRACLNEACREEGLTPTVRFEAGDPRVLAKLAVEGLGVAVVPKSITDARLDELHALTITHPALCGRLAIAWRAEGPIGPAASEFIRRVLAVVSAQREATPSGANATAVG